MYKVFFNERTIFITDDITKNFHANHGLFYKFADVEELKDIIEFYYTVNKIDSLYIFHYDMDYLTEVFKSCFLCIDAAGGLIRNDKNEYLFIMRRGKWDLPKGKVDNNESFQKAALREANEECGLEGLKIVSPMINTYHTYMLKDKLVLKKTYWFEMEYKGSGLPVPQTEEDITEIIWLAKKDIKKVTANTYKTIIDVLHYANLIKL